MTLKARPAYARNVQAHFFFKSNMKSHKLHILFVCMGNICRSPTAEGVFKSKLQNSTLLDAIHVDSAGTHNYHPNSPPDSRSQMHALKRGYDLSHLRARAVNESDFENFDLLLTMDWDNRALLEQRCPTHLHHKIRNFAEFLKTSNATVIPDPYYGEAKDFELVLDLVEDGAKGLIRHCIMSS